MIISIKIAILRPQIPLESSFPQMPSFISPQTIFWILSNTWITQGCFLGFPPEIILEIDLLLFLRIHRKFIHKFLWKFHTKSFGKSFKNTIKICSLLLPAFFLEIHLLDSVATEISPEVSSFMHPVFFTVFPRWNNLRIAPQMPSKISQEHNLSNFRENFPGVYSEASERISPNTPSGIHRKISPEIPNEIPLEIFRELLRII